MEEENPWKIIKSKTVFDTPWIRVRDHAVLNPSGKAGQYGTVHYKNLAIGIIPLDEENNTWIVGQYRFPIEEYSWEIPEGGGPLEVSPLYSAKRELMEECGIQAEKWSKILEFHLSNSVSDEKGIVYIARQLSFHKPNPDDNEQLQLKMIPFADLFEMVMSNQVTDSLTVAGVLKAHILIEQGIF